jgi:Leu/Phe-tRNA-protein transferase
MPLLDVQWCTDHLVSLGAVAIARQEYLARLADAVAKRSWVVESQPPAHTRPSR